MNELRARDPDRAIGFEFEDSRKVITKTNFNDLPTAIFRYIIPFLSQNIKELQLFFFINRLWRDITRDFAHRFVISQTEIFKELLSHQLYNKLREPSLQEFLLRWETEAPMRIAHDLCSLLEIDFFFTENFLKVIKILNLADIEDILYINELNEFKFLKEKFKLARIFKRVECDEATIDDFILSMDIDVYKAREFFKLLKPCKQYSIASKLCRHLIEEDHFSLALQFVEAITYNDHKFHIIHEVYDRLTNFDGYFSHRVNIIPQVEKLVYMSSKIQNYRNMLYAPLLSLKKEVDEIYELFKSGNASDNDLARLVHLDIKKAQIVFNSMN